EEVRATSIKPHTGSERAGGLYPIRWTSFLWGYDVQTDGRHSGLARSKRPFQINETRLVLKERGHDAAPGHPVSVLGGSGISLWGPGRSHRSLASADESRRAASASGAPRSR